MNIKWAELGSVALISFGTAVAAVVLVAFALVALSARATGTDRGDPAAVESRPATGLSPAVGTVVGGLCLLAVTMIVVYGLWIIID